MKRVVSRRKSRILKTKKAVFELRPLAACVRNIAFPLGLMLGASAALAAPENGHVVAGQGHISKPNATTTVINQQSHRLAVDWGSFNINSNELVQFNQPSTQASALNRILDQNPTQIFGSLRANGQVLLVNPNGVYFSPTASVSVGSLVASGLNINNDDFMAGNYKFDVPFDDEGGVIVNQGLLQASTGGSVTLIGGAVKNEGLILATAGSVNLLAGKSVTVDFDGDGLLQFAVSEEVLANVHNLDSAVSNSGEISAPGGSVLMQASAAKDVFSNVVNNSGIVRAGRIENKGGQIRLVATGSSNSLINTGTLDASGSDGDGGSIKIYADDTTLVSGDSAITVSSDSGKAGEIQILGDKVGLTDNTYINVSGRDGGGVALIGGDYQGANPDILNATQTILTTNVEINADALESGDSGKVVVWSDRLSTFSGTISSRGGAESGDGGLVEVSGKEHLSFSGDVNTSAVNGETGTLLLDPKNIVIQNGGAGTAVATVNFADPADPGGLDSIFDADDLAALDTNIILQANNDITFDEALVLSADDLTAQAGRSILVNQNITTGGGNVTLTANDASATASERGPGDGSIIMADGTTIDAGAGNVLLESTNNNSLGGDISVENITSSGNVTLTSGNSSIIESSSDHLVSGNLVTLNGASTAGESVGSASSAINTSATSLAGTAGSGGFYVEETNAVTVTGVSGTGDVEITATTGDLSLDDLTAVSSTSGNITLIATTGSILDSTPGADSGRQISTSGKVTLTASLGSIGSTGTGDIDIDNSPDLVLNAGADLVVRATADLSDLSVTATAGNNEHFVDATNLLATITDDANDFTSLSLTDNSGLNFTFIAANAVSGDGDINVDLIDVSGGTGDVLLATGGGQIVDATAANQVRDIIVADGSVIALIAENATNGSVGAVADALDLETQQLSVSSANDIDIENFSDDAGTGKDLTDLEIKATAGNHTHSIVTTANRLITIDDDATDFNQLSVESTGGPPPALNFNFTAANSSAGDGDIAVDLIESEGGNVIITSTAGVISDLDSGDTDRDIIAGAGSVALFAASANGDVGVAGQTLEVDTAILTINAGNDFDVAVVADDAGSGRDLSDLAITAVSATNTHSLSALNLTNTITDNATDFTDLNLNDSTGLNFSFTAANPTAAEGDIAIGQIDVTNGAVFVTSTAGAITDVSAGDTVRDIIAGTGLINLSASSVNGDVGAAGQALELDTANLTIDSGKDITVDVVSDDSSTGRDLLSLDITAVAGLNAHALTAGGGLTVTIADDATDFTDISATGDALLNFSFEAANTAAGEGDITLGSISVGSGEVVLVSASNGDSGIASAAGAGTDIATTGNIFVTAGAGSIGAAGNLLEVTANNTFDGTANSGAIHIQNNTNIALDFIAETDLSDTVATDVFEYTVAGLGTLQYLSTDDLSITASGAAGSISTTGATIVANNLALNTATGTITANTDATTISVAGTGGNSVTITNTGTNGDTTYDVSTGGAGNIDLTQADNNMLIGALSTTADVTLDSDQGGIDDAQADDITDITSLNLNMTALQGIGSNAQLDVDANLSAINSNGGDIDILGSGAGATMVTGLVESGGGDISISDNDGITVDAGIENTTEVAINSGGGDITLDADLDDNGGGTFTIDDQIDAGAGDILITGSAYDVQDDADLETSGAGDATLEASVAALTYTLGDAATGGSIDFSDAQMDALVVAGVLTIGDASAGAIVLDRATSFGANNLEIITGSTIDDAQTGNALTTTGSLTLTANGEVGSNAGSGADGLTLDVGSLIITSTGNNNVTITDSGAGGDTNYQIGSDGGDVVGDVTITQATNDITLGAGANAGINAVGDTVTLTVSAGSIVDNNGSNQDIIADSLNITDVLNIGDLDDTNNVLVAAIDSIETTIATLTNVVLRSGGEGAIANTGVLVVTAFDLAGAGANASLLIEADDTINAGTATFGGINSGDALGLVASSNNLEIPDAALDLGTGNLRLSAAAGDVRDNTDSDLSNNLISVSNLSISSGTAETIDISVDDLEAHINGASNSLTVTEADALVLSNVDTFDGAIMITAMGTITATDVESTNNFNTATNDITLIANTNATDDILVTTITANGNAGVILTAMDDILDSNTTDANILSAADLTATATSATADTDGIILDTAVTTLDASVLTNAGDITIVDSDGITLGDVDTANGAINVSAAGALVASDVVSVGGSISLTSTAAGDISIGAINSATTVSIDAANGTGSGSIFDADNDAATDITAGGLITLDASADIGSAQADDVLELAGGSTVDASSDTSGEIKLAGIGGGLNLQNLDTADGEIDVSAAGAIVATNIVSVGGEISLTSTAVGDVTVGLINSADTVTIDAGTGSIKDSADDAIVDITAVNLITLDATGDIDGGFTDDNLDLAAGSTVDVSSTTAGEIKLAGIGGGLNLQDVDTVNGLIEVTAAGAIAASDVVSIGGSVVINSTASGDISVGTINSATTVNIDANSGSIIDAANDAVTDITAAGLITLDASGDINGGAADDNLELAAGSTIDASSTGTGEIKLAGIGGGLTLQNIDTNNGEIEVTAAGAIVVTNVNASGGEVLIHSTATGDITLDETGAGGGVVTDDSSTTAVVIINDDGDILDADTATPDDLEAGQNRYNITTGAGGTVNLQANGAGSSIGGTVPDHDDIDVSNARNIDFSASANVLTQLDPSGATGLDSATFTLTPDGVASDYSVRVVGGTNISFSESTDGLFKIDDISNSNNLLDFSFTTLGPIGGATISDIVLDSSGGTAIQAINGGTVTLNANGSIGDANDDTIVDIDTSGLITFIANDEILGDTQGGGFTDNFIELSAGAIINASSTTSGDIMLDGAGALTLQNVVTADGAIVINAAGAVVVTNVDTSNTDIDANDVSITTTTGDIDITAINAGTLGDVVLDTDAGTVDGVGGGTHISADDLTIDATSGIGAGVTLNLAGVNQLDTDTTAGNIDITNTATAATVVMSVTTAGAATIDYTQSGDQSLEMTTLTTSNGDITIANSGGSNADITIGDIDTDTVDDQVMITSSGAVDDAAADGVNDISTVTLSINAEEGIGAGAALEITANAISADTTGGNIDIDNAALGAVTVSSLTTAGTATIAYDQTGNQSLDLDSVTTADGNIDVTNMGGTDADITIGNGAIVADATNDVVTINSSGAIDDDTANPDTTTDITAFSIDLDAVEGIGATADVDIAATTVDADVSAAGNIALNEADAVTLSSLSTNDGSITVAAGGAVTVTGVDSSNTNSDANDVSITTSTGDIDINNIDAGTLGDVVVDTDAGTVDGIGGGPHITADDLQIDATTGIGAGVQLSLSGVDLLDLDTTAEAIDITNAATGETVLISSATTGNGNVDIVTTGANADITIADGAIVADQTDDIVSINSSGAIDDAQANPDTTTDITAFSIDLDSVDGIGGTADVDIAANTVDADVSSAGNIALNEADAVILSSLSTNDGSITVTAGGTVTVTGVDSSNTNSDANDVIITTSTGDIDINGINAGALGDVVVDTDAGAVDGLGGGTHISADDLQIDATTGIGAGVRLSLSGVDLLDLDTTSGSIDVLSAAGGKTVLVSSAKTTDGDIDIATSGANADITIADGAIVADLTDDIVSIISSGAIDDAQANPNTATDITAFSIVLSALDGIGATADVDTNTTTLDLNVTNAGLIAINELDGLTVTSAVTTDGNITIAAGDNMEVGTITAGNAMTIDLSTTAGDITDTNGDSDLTASNISLDAAGGIGSNTNNINTTTTNALTLMSAGAGTTGDIFIDETTSMDTGDVMVTTAVATSQSVSIEANDWTVDAGLGNAQDNLSLSSSAGSIVDGGGTLTANTLTLDVSATGGATIGATGAGNEIETNVATLSVDASNGAGGIFINEVDGVDLAFVDSGTGAFEISTNGDLTDSGTITVGTTTNIDTGGNNVSLDNGDGLNDFGGDVTLNNVDNVLIEDSNAIQFATSTIGGTFDVTAGGDITDSGTLTVTGVTTLDAGGNDVILDDVNNDFMDTVNVSNTNNLTIDDTNALTLGTVSTANNADIDAGGAVDFTGVTTVGGTLNVDTTVNGAGGAITDIGGQLLITGTTTLDAAANDIVLDNPANDFGGAVTITNASNVDIQDSDNIDFGASTIGGTFDVTAGGDITDSGTLMVTGVTTLDAGGNDVILDDMNNDFMDTVNVSNTDNLTIDDTNALTLGTVSTANNADIDAGGAVDFTGVTTVGGTLNVDTTANGTGGTITDTGGQLLITGTTTLDAAANDIILDNPANDFGGAVAITNANNVDIQDSDNIDFGASTIGGTFDVTADGDITDSGTLMVTGVTTLDAGGNDVILDDVNNDFMDTVNVSNTDSLTIDDTNALTLGTVTTTNNADVDAGGAVDFTGVTTVGGTLNVDTTANGAGGAITDTGGQLLITGTTTLDAGANVITLDEDTNDFDGALTLTNTGANVVTIHDSNDLAIDTVNVGDNLVLNYDRGANDSSTLDLSAATVNTGTNAISIDAQGSDDAILMSNTANVWTTTATNSGTVNDGTNTFTYTDVASLTGNDMTDTFNIGHNVDGTISGGDGANIYNLNAGTVGGNITGGANADTFNFTNASVTGTVNGADGVNTLDYSAFAAAPVAVTLTTTDTNGFQGTADNTGGFQNMTNLTGSGNAADTLTGVNADATWSIQAGDETYVSGGETLTIADGTIRNFIGGSAVDTFNVTANNTNNLAGGSGNDNFNLNAGALGGVMAGGLGIDTFNLNGGTVTGTVNGGGGTADSLVGGSSYTLTGNNSGTNAAIGGGWSNIENLTGTAGNDTFNFNNGTLSGTADGLAGNDLFDFNGGTAGSIDGQGGVDILNFANAGGQTIAITGLGGTDGFSGTSTNVTNSFDDINTIIGSAATDTLGNASNADSTFNINNGSGTFVSTNTLVFSSLDNFAGGSGSDTFNITGDHTGNLSGGAGNDEFNSTSANVNGNVTGGSGVNTYELGSGRVNGTIVVSGNDIWIHTAGVQLADSVTGNGSLTIPNTTGGGLIVSDASGNDLVVDSSDLNLPTLSGFNGHLIIGGLLLPPTLPISGDSQVNVNTDLLTINENIVTNGDLTLLGSNVDLNADLNAGGIGGDDILIVAVGSQNGGSDPGNITAVATPTTIEAGSLTLIAANDIVNSESIDVELNGGEIQVAVGEGVETPQFGLLDATAADLSVATSAFITSFFNTNLQSVGQNVSAANQAGGLIGLEQLGNIDVGLFEEELTLFGAIGGGIALSLYMCEEVEGCAPNVNETELAELILNLQARLEELKTRVAEEGDGESKTELENLISAYEEELRNFESYREELRKFFSEDEGSTQNEEQSSVDVSTQVDNLRDVLQVAQSRIDWLESLKSDPETRASLSQRSGIDLTIEQLEIIINATQQEMLMLERQIQSLLDGVEAHNEAPVFSQKLAEANLWY
ncbi:MAG: filamentous hemagglutinin N-terminal domain-containing protein [Gammaproteobacteria bacterium]|nr:filamentous hemagglutinin N-terminal domain-containing protein [Gammaproteobacteria bacterium]